MPAEDNLNKKIIEALKSLPRVSLGAEEKATQLDSIAVAVSTGAVTMKEFPLSRLIWDRIKEELVKYSILSALVVSVFIAGTLGYLVYPQIISKPPVDEKPVLTQQSKEKNRSKSETKTDSADLTEQKEQAETQEEQTSGETDTETGVSTGTIDDSPRTSTNGSGSSSGQTTTEQPSSSQTPPSESPAQTTEPTPNQAPTCDLQIRSDQSLTVGHPVELAASYSDPDGKIVKVKWDLGDGNFLEHGPDINLIHHIYGAVGTYKVTLTVFDDDGASAQVSKTVSITEENQAPVADFSSNAPKKVGQPVTFHNKSYDVDGFIVEVKWDFGDGATSTEKNPTHVYRKAGNYKVTLTVKDDGGATSSISKTITIR